MLLQNKNAVIYGGGGAVGGAVARAFAREGATVYLAGRTLAGLDRVAQEISAAGGKAESAEVDAMDERAVDRHADGVSCERDDRRHRQPDERQMLRLRASIPRMLREPQHERTAPRRGLGVTVEGR